MFGSGNLQRYLKNKAEVPNLPRRDVTRGEFIRLMTANGEPQRNARFQASISAGLGEGCYTRVGDEMIRVASATEKK
jgi:hypothetical protein